MERPLKVAIPSQTPDHDPLLVALLGPTASGKTSLSLALARHFHGEIVHCDSVAMYREFEIGTAKPSAAERAEIPHHLVDYVDPLGDVTAGEYARQARQILRDLASRKIMPIVSGGTGLYLRALLEGLFSAPKRPAQLRNTDLPNTDLPNTDLPNTDLSNTALPNIDFRNANPGNAGRRDEVLRAKLRARAEKRGPAYLHCILQRLDAKAANRIHPNDVPKVIRAIEVSLTSAQPMTEIWQQGRVALHGFRILRLGLHPDREALYARIDQRAAKMFDDGLIAETERLQAKYGDQARPLSSLGYKQALQFLRGELNQKSALTAARQAHRNYAKRQMTWFRREPDVHWLAGFGDNPAIQQEAIAVVAEKFLTSFQM